MRQLIFEGHDNSLITVKIDGTRVKVITEIWNNEEVDVSQMITEKNTDVIIKEFPQLKGFRSKSIVVRGRILYQKKLESLGNEDAVKEYVISDMVGKHGLKYLGGK